MPEYVSQLIGIVKDIGMLSGFITVVWLGGKLVGEIKTAIKGIESQVNNHIPTQIKDMDTKFDKKLTDIDTKYSNKLGEVHNRVNVNDKAIGRLEGRVEA